MLQGFYAVYRGVFETITEQDHEFVDDEDFEDPGFGDSQSSYEQVCLPFNYIQHSTHYISIT